MIDEYLKNQNINAQKIGKYVFLEKDGVILDKICPECKRVIIQDNDFCECGFFLKAQIQTKLYFTVLIIAVFTIFLILVFVLNFDKVQNFKLSKIKENNIDLSSLSPINIQIMTNLKKTSYRVYIQGIYVNPKEENTLMIMIKPTLWGDLTDKEKQDLTNQVFEQWEVIYKHNHPESLKKPFIKFANHE
ncbi:MAG: hypothetical protein MZV64_27115 [Ignavibacteriales bacterium]|nr:hypothetical protein [Ignavibacteriales bacterium]